MVRGQLRPQGLLDILKSEMDLGRGWFKAMMVSVFSYFASYTRINLMGEWVAPGRGRGHKGLPAPRSNPTEDKDPIQINDQGRGGGGLTVLVVTSSSRN